MSYVIPDEKAVNELLSIILGDGLSVTANDSPEFESRYIATFINDENKLVAVCASDLPFAGFSGAALAMIPVGTVEDCIKANELTESLSANFYEIMNICSRLMLSDTSDHLKLDKTLAPGDLPEGIEELKTNSEVVGFEVDIPRYGAGKMDFLIAA